MGKHRVGIEGTAIIGQRHVFIDITRTEAAYRRSLLAHAQVIERTLAGRLRHEVPGGVPKLVGILALRLGQRFRAGVDQQHRIPLCRNLLIRRGCAVAAALHAADRGVQRDPVAAGRFVQHQHGGHAVADEGGPREHQRLRDRQHRPGGAALHLRAQQREQEHAMRDRGAEMRRAGERRIAVDGVVIARD